MSFSMLLCHLQVTHTQQVGSLDGGGLSVNPLVSGCLLAQGARLLKVVESGQPKVLGKELPGGVALRFRVPL